MEEITIQKQKYLKEIAAKVRARTLISVHHAAGGHVGGPLSCTDILVALYFHVLNIDPTRPDWEDRDRFILSKGHSTIALYAVLAERGFFPVDELTTFDAIDSRLQGHPDMTKTPGIDMSSGSLGQGISPAIGMAIGAKLLNKSFQTYVIIGDGESQEGQIWEAAFVAARYQLGNLTVVLDYNGLQQFGWHKTGEHMLTPIENPGQKWQAFGWNVIEINGHDFKQIVDAIHQAQQISEKPSIIIAHTTKGKGVSFIEDQFEWHARVPSDTELEKALIELGQKDPDGMYLAGGGQ